MLALHREIVSKPHEALAIASWWWLISERRQKRLGWSRVASACRWMQRPCKEVFGHICLTPSTTCTSLDHDRTLACLNHFLPSQQEFYHQRRVLNLATKLHSGFKSLKHISMETLGVPPPSSSLRLPILPPGCQRQPAAVLPNPDRREIITWKKVIMWSHPESKKMPAREGFLMVNHVFCKSRERCPHVFSPWHLDGRLHKKD